MLATPAKHVELHGAVDGVDDQIPPDTSPNGPEIQILKEKQYELFLSLLVQAKALTDNQDAWMQIKSRLKQLVDGLGHPGVLEALRTACK